MPTAMQTDRRFRFTHQLLDALPAHDPASAAREMEYTDTEIVGLRMLVSKNGRKFFYLRFRYRGVKRMLRIGEFPSVSLKDARVRAHEAKGILARGEDPAAEHAQRAGIPTLEAFALNDYLPHAKQHKKSWRDDEVRLHKEILPRFGARTLDAVSAREVQAMHTALKSSHTPATANRYLALIQRLYSFANQFHVYDKNPARFVKKYREYNARERYLSKEEIASFLEQLAKLENRPIAAGLRFLLFTGLRKNEAFHLQWKHVDREGGTVFLDKTKSGKTRTVILNVLAREVIEEMWAAREPGHEYVFPGKRKGEPVANPQKPFEEACKLGKIRELRIHDLRHSFASLAINSGASLYDVQKLLGHSSSIMTQRYAHLADESVRKATEQVARQISLG